MPGLQQPAIGDPLPLSAAGGLIFHAIKPNEYLIWSGASGRFPGAFTWALYPVDANHTRLVSRIQWSHHWTQPLALFMDLFTEFADHLAVRKILHGVKDRAEGRIESFSWQTFEFAMLVWGLFAFFAALWMVVRGPPSWPRWLSALVAGMAWLLVWYAPIPVVLGAGVNVLVCCLVFANRRGGVARHTSMPQTIARRAT